MRCVFLLLNMELIIHFICKVAVGFDVLYSWRRVWGEMQTDE